MLINVLFHWGLELGADGILLCILWGCSNTDHTHGQIVNFFAGNKYARWTLNAILTLIMAFITVNLMG